jgi:polyphenol oxidase
MLRSLLKTRPFKLKQTGNFAYFYQPDLEAAGIIHGFCTRNARPLPAQSSGREEFLSTFSFLDCIGLEQEHSDGIHIIEEGAPAPRAGDGLVLIQKEVAGIIRTADCVPVILCEPTACIAAIVHAGWRGAALGIAGKAARMMVGLGATPSLIQALIGPSIGPCCYEVKEDVVERFREAGFNETIVARRNRSTFLDLRKANGEDLKAEGVNNIQTLDLCTRCRQDLFFSARRNESGRQFSFVAIVR